MFCQTGTFRNGFTLVEMLVVMAVVALIVAISFPVFKKVIAGSQNTKCQMNLKSLGVACLAYAADNDGYLPANGPVSEGGTNASRHVTAWARYNMQMAPYGLSSPNKAWAALCPSDKEPLTMRPGSLTSYAIPGPVSPGSRWCGPSFPNSGPFPRVHQLSNPSKVIMLFEFFGNHYGDPPGSGCIAANGKPAATLNVAFLDGHVGKFKSDRPWFHLEYHWRNYGLGGNASLSDRVHVLSQ